MTNLQRASAPPTTENTFPLHEIKPNQPDWHLSFRMHRFERSNSHAQADFPHRHDFYQLLFVTAGNGLHIIDCEPFAIQPPVVYILNTSHVHFWRLTCALQGYGVLFSPSLLATDTFGLVGSKSLTIARALELTPERKLTPAEATSINALIQTMYVEYDNTQPDYASVLWAYLHILLTKTLQLYANDKHSPHVEVMPTLVHQFKHLVAEHILSDRSVSSYARRIGVSTGHLSDAVKRATGQTPSQIIRSTLLLEAKRLLINTNHTVQHISSRLAFEDPSYFGRFFSREVHMSPGKFRASFRKKYQIAQRQSLDPD